MADLSFSIGRASFKNPIFTASGTFGYAKEFEQYINLHNLGGVVVKGISMQPRKGNPPPRIVETACGMLNAIGLENVGVDGFVREKMPYLRKIGTKVIVNVLGDTVEEYGELAKRLDEIEGIAALELNISCPNVKKGGVAFGTDQKLAMEVTSSAKRNTRLPVIVKLSPNVTDVAGMARAVEEGGADAVSLINTLIGMAIDIERKQPVLANVIGGLSGPAIKPVALRMVWQVADAVDIPIIGIGGISTWQDALEFLFAGATAVQVGTANFFNPSASEQILEGIRQYCDQKNISTLNELVAAAKCLQ